MCSFAYVRGWRNGHQMTENSVYHIGWEDSTQCTQPIQLASGIIMVKKNHMQNTIYSECILNNFYLFFYSIFLFIFLFVDPEKNCSIFEPTCAYARWTLMHRFLSVCLSGWDVTKIQTGPKVTWQKMCQRLRLNEAESVIKVVILNSRWAHYNVKLHFLTIALKVCILIQFCSVKNSILIFVALINDSWF